MGRNDETASSADVHAHHTVVPALDDLSSAELEDERLIAIPRRVKLFATGGANADVVHDGLLTSGGFGPITDDDVFDEEFIGRRSEMGFNEWFFCHERKP